MAKVVEDGKLVLVDLNWTKPKGKKDRTESNPNVEARIIRQDKHGCYLELQDKRNGEKRDWSLTDRLGSTGWAFNEAIKEINQ